MLASTVAVAVLVAWTGPHTASLAGQAPSPDYRAGSLASGESPAPFADDARDPWNRIFRALFTRDVTLRLTQEYPQGAPFTRPITTGFPPSRLASERTFVRRESGDRPIVPLYPSLGLPLGLLGCCVSPCILNSGRRFKQP